MIPQLKSSELLLIQTCINNDYDYKGIISVNTYSFKKIFQYYYYMEKKSDKEEIIFVDKESEISLFLNNFIKTLNIEEEELVDMTSSNLLLESLDKGYNIEYFKKIINEKNLSNKFTGLFLCGFNQNDDLSIIRLIEKYNGTYNVQLNYDQMNREESNEIYAVFSNPLEAYECFGEIDNLNKNNEIEDLSYLL